MFWSFCLKRLNGPQHYFLQSGRWDSFIDVHYRIALRPQLPVLVKDFLLTYGFKVLASQRVAMGTRSSIESITAALFCMFGLHENAVRGMGHGSRESVDLLEIDRGSAVKADVDGIFFDGACNDTAVFCVESELLAFDVP